MAMLSIILGSINEKYWICVEDRAIWKYFDDKRFKSPECCPNKSIHNQSYERLLPQVENLKFV